MTTKNELCQLLPWYINGTLEQEDMEVFSTHINSCEECAAEFNQAMELSRAIQAPPQGAEELLSQSKLGFSKLQKQIEEQIEQQSTASKDKKGISISGFFASLRLNWSDYQWLYSGSIGAALAVFVMLLLPLSNISEPTNLTNPGYQTENDFVLLSSDNQVVPLIQVIFEEEATERQIRDFVTTYDLELTGNPSSAGVYRLRINNLNETQAQLDTILATDYVRWASVE